MFTSPPARYEGNHLLRALPVAIRNRWSPHLVKAEMPVGMALADPNLTNPSVWFPTTSIVSLLYSTARSAPTEVAVVGREGMIGVALLLGGGSKTMLAVVNSAGQGYQMEAAIFKREVARSSVVLHLLLRFTQALITQLAQTAVCNRHHALVQQVSRLLLLMLDRSEGEELTMTHDAIANMIGVRRESVTEAAQQLQRDGLIQYSRGRVAILDRLGLELASCECYGVVRQEYDRVLPTLATGQ